MENTSSQIMVFRPSFEEFKDFPKYIKYMESKGAHKAGVAKVIPPPEWRASKHYDMDVIGEMLIKTPVSQNANGHQANREMEDRKCTNPSCTLDADKRCSRCHVTYYCSKVCQEADWKVHKKVCKEKIQNSAEWYQLAHEKVCKEILQKAREGHKCTSCTLKADRNCSRCHGNMMEDRKCTNPSCTLDADKRCSRCHVTYYCSKVCQGADWKVHKKVCKEIIENSEEWYLLAHERMEPSRLISSASNMKSYKCVEISGKGLGMIATKDIKAGDIILEEKPIMRWKGGKLNLTTAILKFTKLSIYDQKKVLSLYDKDLPKTLGGIINTNAFGIGGLYALLCHEISRFNHSCMPNVRHLFDKSVQAIATRNIKCGEELCITYINPRTVTRERKRLLNNSYGFACKCSVCILSEKEQIERDKKIMRYNILAIELQDILRELHLENV